MGVNPIRRMLQPEATGAVMEVTKWLKPSGKASHDSADEALVVANVQSPMDVHNAVVPGRNLSMELVLARIPVG